MLSLFPQKDHPARTGKNSPAPEDLPLRHIGIDEAGRGCLAGPVVAAAVFFAPDFEYPRFLPGLTDSKKLSAPARDRLSLEIPDLAIAWGIGYSWQEEIDAVNILNATFRAMSRAVLGLVEALRQKSDPKAAPPHLLVDGAHAIPLEHWLASTSASPKAGAWERYLSSPLSPLTPACLPQLPEQTAVVDGDARVPAISAASVLAKTTRDRLMTCLAKDFPGYGLEEHKGYGTKEHLAAIARQGPCPLHRKSFKGVRPESRQAGLL